MLPLPQCLDQEGSQKNKEVAEEVQFQELEKTRNSLAMLRIHQKRPVMMTQTLWKRKGTEVVIAAVRSNNGNSIICLRHNDFISLRPHNLLNGEVDFDQYDGVIGFVNENNNHWKFLYLNAPTSQIFIVDPADHESDLEESREAATRFR
ncbi:hypothetical protein N1851_009445 [Merluccius polli]|uniref:Uncharacterized protein n=1 Tax=Merluccius polli TaxID=89951 RepID=A0AA47N073_MERPO|nr:hypothetical protein N1851_009445 [Merluccius polli]